MGIGDKDTSDIPAREKMQGMNGSAVVGPSGQHTEAVEAVDELADRLTVAVQKLCQFHIGSRYLSHLQHNINALDFISGSCPHSTVHQAVEALLSERGKPAFQKKIPLSG